MSLSCRMFSLLIGVSIAGSHLHAAELALDFVNTTELCCLGSAAGQNAVGWSFTTSVPYYVTALGLFDYGSDGLHEAAPVTLWKSGSAVATATISNSSLPMASTESRGRWLFESTTPVLIVPGEYVIGVYYASDSPQDRGMFDFVDNATRLQHTTAGGITYGGYRFNNGGIHPGGSHPTDDGYFGPNLLVVAVPEPSVIWLLSSALLARAVLGPGRHRIPLKQGACATG